MTRLPQARQKHRYYPLNARQMAATCRRLAADLRAEHATGQLPSIQVSGPSGARDHRVSRDQAAASLDEQAKRWEREVKTGKRNEVDRARIGL